MNQMILSWKFISRKGGTSRRSWSIYIPVLGVMLGTMVVSLTFAVMDGMELEIFQKLRNFPAPARLAMRQSGKDSLEDVRHHLANIGIQSYRMLERKAILSRGDQFRIITVRAVESFAQYSRDFLSPESEAVEKDSTGLYLGRELADRLDLLEGMEVFLISPLDVSLISGTPPRVALKVTGKYEMELVDMDLNYAFVPYETGLKLFKNNRNPNLILSNELSESQIAELHDMFPDTQYRSWQTEYGDLVAAMKLEKLAYTGFGFMIVCISSFNLLSIMMMSVMRKIPQIGILGTMGWPPARIAGIFIIKALLTGISGGLAGLAAAVLVIRAEAKWHLIHQIMGSFPMMSFPLLLGTPKMVVVFVISLLLVLAAGIYPAWKASKLAPIDAIEHVK